MVRLKIPAKPKRDFNHRHSINKVPEGICTRLQADERFEVQQKSIFHCASWTSALSGTDIVGTFLSYTTKQKPPLTDFEHTLKCRKQVLH